MTAWLSALRDGARQFNITLTSTQEDRFADLLALLLARNQEINLTSITDPVEIARKHFVDSLSVETVWQPGKNERGIDIGTGAGFPGLPVAIRYPQLPLILNDSARKKVDYLRDAVMKLELRTVQPVWARAEELGHRQEYRSQFTVAFVRAVAHLALLIEYALPLLRVGGRLIAMKGPSNEHEIAESAVALEKLGGIIEETRMFELPEIGSRMLIVIRAQRKSPTQFPRDPGVAKKRRL